MKDNHIRNFIIDAFRGILKFSLSSTNWFWWVFGLLVLVRLATVSQFTTHVDDILPLTEAIRRGINVYSPWEVIKLSRNYTYAPLQFVFSLPLAFSLSDSWLGLLFWSRAFSLIIWAMGVAVGFRVLESILGAEKRLLAILGGLIMAFSLRGAAESSQGYNYASTLIITVGMGWLIATESGHAFLKRSWFAPLYIGLLLAVSVWTTYQTVFLACGFFLSLGLICIWKRDWVLLAKGILMGTILSIGFVSVYKLVIMYIVSFAKTIPPWPNVTLPGTNVSELITYPFRALWTAAQNNLTFLPWGWQTQVLTLLLMTVALYGTIAGLVRHKFSATAKRAYLWILCLYVGLIALGYCGQFALGVTRHSFLFQFPLIVFVILGLSYWEWKRQHLFLLSMAVLLLGAIGQSHYIYSSRRQADLNWLQQELKSNPEAIITDFPTDVSWDFLLFAHPDRSLLKRMYVTIFLPRDTDDRSKPWSDLFRNASIVYVYSHRIKLDTHHLEAVRRVGNFKVTPLAEVDPISSAEISGLINAGNGFYFYKFERLR